MFRFEMWFFNKDKNYFLLILIDGFYGIRIIINYVILIISIIKVDDYYVEVY